MPTSMGYAPFPRGGYAPQVGGESRAESHRPPKFFQTTLPRGSLNGIYIYTPTVMYSSPTSSNGLFHG